MIYFILPVIVIALDQISKYLISSNLLLFEEITIIPNFFRLTYCKNTGVAFSMFNDSTSLITIFTIVLIAFIIYMLIKEKDKFSKIMYSLILGGAIGNLIDRLLYGYVIDFLSFTIFGSDFAVFNIADSFITVCVILILIKEIIGVIKCQK